MIEFLGRVDKEIKSNIVKVYNYIINKFSLPENVQVNISFVTEKKIQELNKSTRNIDKVTDVLTYPYINLKVGQKLKLEDYSLDIDQSTNTLTIGDIYICTARAKQQAKEYNHSLNREICFLFCHGMLHILGYDHITKQQEELMTKTQEEILTALNITRNLPTEFKSGFVTILGETNVGKSTLINRLVGQFVAIVSPKSQTTRENILGIYNDDKTQIVFVDTPGYHKRANVVDDEMDKNIVYATLDSEVILMLVSARKPVKQQAEKILNSVKSNAYKILVINKVDESSYEKLYPQLVELNNLSVDEIIPISALKGTNCDKLLELIKKYLPTYDYEMRYYPIEEYTDKTMRQIVAEIIREKALYLLDDEVPHGIQVLVTGYDENSTPIKIDADLYCERQSHKAIILGKDGAMIKQISTAARKTIEKFIGSQINLQIYVRVKPNWRNDIKTITEFGLNAQN